MFSAFSMFSEAFGLFWHQPRERLGVQAHIWKGESRRALKHAFCIHTRHYRIQNNTLKL